MFIGTLCFILEIMLERRNSKVDPPPPYIGLNLKWQAAERSLSILGVRADEL